MAIGDTVGLLFKISADSSDATQDIEKLRGSISSQLGQIEGLFSKLGLPTGFFSQLTQLEGAATKGLGTVATEGTAAAGALGAVAGAAPLVLGAVTAVAGVLVTAGIAAFGLAQGAAAAGSEVYDLSQRTGISVETLSAFRLAATQSNTSLDEFAGGVSRFNRLIGEAASGTEEAKEKLKQFGIEPQEALRDQEGALAKVFEKINELPPGIQRSIAAQEAFGKSGDRLVDMIQSVGGNLDEYMRKARESGQVISTEAAGRADEFGDKLDALRFRLSEVGRHIGEQLIPHIIQWLDELDKDLSQNGEQWKQLGREIGAFIDDARKVKGVLDEIASGLNRVQKASEDAGLAMHNFFAETFQGSYADRFVGWLKQPFGINTSEWQKGTGKVDMSQVPFADPAKVLEETRRREEEERNKKTQGNNIDTSFFRSRGGGGGGGSAANKSQAEQNAEKDRRAELEHEQVRLQAAQRAYRGITEAAKASYQDRLTSLDQYVAAEKQAEEDLYQAKLKVIANERAAVEADRKLRPKERTAKSAALDEREAQAVADRDSAIARVEAEAQRRREQALRENLRTLEQIAVVRDRASIASVRSRVELRTLTEQEGERQIQSIQLAALDRRRETLEADLEMAGHDLERRRQVNLEIKQLEAERAAFVEDGERRLEEAHRRDLERLRERAAAVRAAREQLGGKQEENQRAILERLQKYGQDQIQIIQFRAQLESDAEDRRHERAQAELDRDRQELLDQAATNEERLEVERIFHERREAERERHRLRMQEIKEQEQADYEREDPTSDRSLFGDELADQLLNAEGPLQRFGTIASSIFGEVSKNAGNMRSILGGAFQALGQGIGQVVQNFVLLGNLGPQSIRKMTAQILAGVAAQAAVKAIFELAEGLAALANPFTAWRAPIHFAAAKTYGLIAGVAAVAGRVAAGNSFQNDARNEQGTPTGSRLAAADRPGGSSGSIGGTTAGSTASDPNQVQVLERERKIVEVVIRHEPGTVVEIVRNDYFNQGGIKTLLEDGR